ncbi:MAG: thioredoxin family protein [Sedimentisphaerales bacterium]|nr:thioredoxin family protein [Sedimentisphaerales bacterium]
MNFRIVVSLLLICIFSFSCTSRQKSPGDINIEIGDNVDPNTVAIVTLKLEGKTLPGTLKVVSAEDTTAAFFERIGSAEDTRKVKKDTWVTVLTSGKSYVIGWIVKDNKMFGYCSEPFVAQNGLKVSFSPGLPASLEYDLSKPEEGVNVFPVILLLSRKAVKNGEISLMSWGEPEMIEEPKVIKIDKLAQGSFQLYAQAIKGEEYLDSRMRFLYDKRFIEIEPGINNCIEAQYPVLDDTVEDGDVTIKGMAYNSAGEILPNETIRLIPLNGNNPRHDLYYPDAVTDSNGSFEFKGIRPDIAVLIKNDNASIKLPQNCMTKNASLWVDMLVGKLNMQFYAGYSVTEKIIVDWKDGRKSDLMELYDKIIVANVWSSWCEPSQKSLDELNTIAQEFKDNNDVVFAAISLDAGRTVWEDTVNKSGLNALRHCWFDREENPLAFNRTIPYSMIIDKKGIVSAEGNGIDIRAELKKAIEASK